MIFSPNLSDGALRQRSLPSPGAVLDVAGGGESEEPQQGQQEGGLRHGSWSVYEHRAPGADVPPSPGRTADCWPLAHSSLYKRADQTPPHPPHPPTHSDVISAPFCSPLLASNATAVRACARSRCGLASMCAIKPNARKYTACAAEVAFFCIQGRPTPNGKNFFGIIRTTSTRADVA